MKVYFCCYSDKNYREQQKELLAEVKRSKQFDAEFGFTREWLVRTEFYAENKEILDMPRGGGYWLWKPYIILQSFSAMEPNDILLYLDSADSITGNIRETITTLMTNKDIYLTWGSKKPENRNAVWTKRDCFVGMGMDEERYWNSSQLEAGIILAKKTLAVYDVIQEWMYYCSRKEIVTDQPNIWKENFPDFKEHRHDQSILTNLKQYYKLPTGDELRKHITCNVRQNVD